MKKDVRVERARDVLDAIPWGDSNISKIAMRQNALEALAILSKPNEEHPDNNALSIYVSRNENPYLTTQEFEQAEKLLYPHMSADNSTELQPLMRQKCTYFFTREDTDLVFTIHTPLDIMAMATQMVGMNCQEGRYMLEHDGTPVYGDEIGCGRMVWRIQELVRARRRTKEEKEEIEGIDAPQGARRLELNNRIDNMLLSIYYLSVLVIWHRDMEGHMYEIYETYPLPTFDLAESLDRMQVKLID